MKSVQMAVGIAATIAIASVGLEARAQGVTRAECEANALRSYNAELQRCAQKSGMEYMGCRIFAFTIYQETLGYCSQIPTRGGKTPVIETSRPSVLEGYLPSLVLPSFLDGWF